MSTPAQESGAVVALCSSPLQSWPFVVVVVFSLTDWELQARKGLLGQRCLTDGGPGTFVSKCVLKPPKPQRTAKIISVTMPFLTQHRQQPNLRPSKQLKSHDTDGGPGTVVSKGSLGQRCLTDGNLPFLRLSAGLCLCASASASKGTPGQGSSLSTAEHLCKDIGQRSNCLGTMHCPSNLPGHY